MKMRWFICSLMVISMVVCEATDFTKQKDQPLLGEYNFPMETVWQTNNAGGVPFGLLSDIRVCDDGTIVCRDLRLKRFHVFSLNGDFVASFGELGEGPGQIKDPGSADLYTFGKQIIIHDGQAFKYFDIRGQFVKQVKRPLKASTPTTFLSPSQYISAPNSLAELPGDGIARILKVDIETGKIEEIGQFKVFKGGTFQEERTRAVIVISSITPVLVVGNTPDTLYFGSNDTYSISVADMNGHVKGQFGVVREPVPVTVKEREDVLLAIIKGLAPEEVIRPLAKRLPEKQTQFTKVHEMGGLIYVQTPYFAPRNHTRMDIFSKAGVFLYRGIARIKPDELILVAPIFYQNYLVLSVQDEEGDQILMVAKTKLPVEG